MLRAAALVGKLETNWQPAGCGHIVVLDDIVASSGFPRFVGVHMSKATSDCGPHYPDFATFRELAKEGHLVPVCRRLVSGRRRLLGIN